MPVIHEESLSFATGYTLLATGYSSGVTGFDEKFSVLVCKTEANDLP